MPIFKRGCIAVAVVMSAAFLFAWFMGDTDFMDAYERLTSLAKAILAPLVVGGIYILVKWVMTGTLTHAGSAPSAAGTEDHASVRPALQGKHLP